MLGLRVSLLVTSLTLLNVAMAQTEIHKCTNADGGVTYSQLPCTPQKPVEPKKAATDEPVETAVPEPVERESEPKEDANTAACKKRYREAIDAIDAEIGREYSPEKSDQYKQRLLALTRELRRC